MGRGGSVGGTQNHKKRIKFGHRHCDDSDEDYVVEEDEETQISDGFDENLSDASEEIYDSFIDDEAKVEKEVRRTVKSKIQSGSLGQKHVEVRKPWKRKPYEEDEDYVGDENFSDASEEIYDNFQEVDVEKVVKKEVRHTVKWNVQRVSSGQNKTVVQKPQKRKRISYEDDEDYVGDDSGDSDDDGNEEDDVEEEEFTIHEIDSSGDEEESLIDKNKWKKRKNVGRSAITKKRPCRGKKSKKGLKKTLKKKRGSDQGLLREACNENETGLAEGNPIFRIRGTENSCWRRRRSAALSDSDFVSSEASDPEYTINEEEGDQAREDDIFGQRVERLRNSSSSSKLFQDDGLVLQQPRIPGKKGKEKVGIGAVMLVCGICLSEEGKRTVRGTLDCCNHYFCFSCIHEWSKVESRCPVCKQRFVSISKPSMPNRGIHFRNAVIPIPERDQVYQPSEEEMSMYLDPYEHVICTECQQGGDDALLLLCDLCDSPAHTFCVGLGRVVPEGNWYCEGCRPVAFGSSNFEPQDPHPERTAGNSSAVETIRESLDCNYSSLPHSFTRGFGNVRSAQATSPLSGDGPSTLSGRRWRHRQMHHLLSREPAFQHARNPETGTGMLALFEERIPDSPSTPPNRNPSLERMNLFRRQLIPDSITTAADHSIRETSRDDYTAIDLTLSSQQLSQGDGLGGSQFYAVKEQLQSMVRSHLQSLSREMELGCGVIEVITQRCMHTILAACGLEDSTTDMYSVPPPSVCSHIEMVSGGQVSLMKGCCSSCFMAFVGSIVRRIMKTHLLQR